MSTAALQKHTSEDVKGQTHNPVRQGNMGPIVTEELHIVLGSCSFMQVFGPQCGTSSTMCTDNWGCSRLFLRYLGTITHLQVEYPQVLAGSTPRTPRPTQKTNPETSNSTNGDDLTPNNINLG